MKSKDTDALISEYIEKARDFHAKIHEYIQSQQQIVKG